MDQSRTKKSIINISAALIGQMLSLIIAFITRIIFTRELGDIYLGTSPIWLDEKTVLFASGRDAKMRPCSLAL